MSAIVTSKPNVKWDDVAGLTPAKEELQRAIVFPARFPNLYDERRKPSGAILLYGPPGTGKSYLAKAVATEVDHTFFSISSADVVSKWMGESEKLIRHLFTLAREHKPSIIFIDEIDALCSSRQGAGGADKGGNEHSARLKTELLVQLDGLHSTGGGGGGNNDGVVVLAATNLPWALDPAFRRRFEPRVRAGGCSASTRPGAGADALAEEEDPDALADMTAGYSGSDIAHVVKHALAAPLRAVQSARFFRAEKRETAVDGGGDKNGNGDGEETHDCYYYTPCREGEQGALEMTWEEVPKNRLREPPVTAEDFRQVLRERRVKSSVGAGELQRYEDWTNEFGIDGSS
ncbi:hypothetical protein VTG60DRAFT_6953 [Thermothelomyces hinnuleus]